MSDQDNGTPDLDLLMEQAGRELLEARMLPNDGPLSPAQRADVLDAFKKYVAKHKLKQNEIARQIPSVGISNLNAILNDKYRHDKLDDHLREMNQWMEVDARRRQTKSPRKFVETRVAKLLLGAASKASQLGGMVIAHGPTGIGKSMAAHVIVEKFPGAIHIRLSTGNVSYMALRRMLATRLRMFGKKRGGARENTHLTYDERIFDKLRGSGRLILIDEAHRIGDSALEFLRDIHDECGVPIVFFCTKDLVDRIRKDADVDHGQLYSRFSYICDLTQRHKGKPGESHPLFTADEIRRIYESDRVKLHPHAQAFLLDVANDLGHGSLRACDALMISAIALVRTARGLGHGAKVIVNREALEKCEREAKRDQSMLFDLEERHGASVRTA